MKKQINWGIIAPGGIAEKFASDLKLVSDANLIAVASRNSDRAKSFSEKFNSEKYYGSYEDLVNDDDVDVVYIASPHTFHYQHTLLCLNHGKHVLCEKPMGMNVQQVKEMESLAKEKGLFLMEAFWTRFSPSYLKCRQLIENGEIGEIQLLQADFGFKANNDINGRLLNKELGGGALLDIGIYPVFLALSLLGEPDTIKSSGILGPTGVDLSNAIILEYKSKNALATLSSTLLANTPIEAVISGSGGSIKFERQWHCPTSLEVTINNEVTIFNFKEKGFGYQYEAKEVNDCLLKGKQNSNIFPVSQSILLHTTLDAIRHQIGLKYSSDTK